MADLVTVEVVQILAEQPADHVLVQEVEVIEVLAVAEQGPRGIQGPQGPAGGSRTMTVGVQALSGHTIVAADASGRLVYADSTTTASHGAVVGLIADAYSPGDLAVVQTAFTLEHSGWSWTPGPVFVGAMGQPTQTVPPGSMFSQVVAHALSPTLLLIELQPPITVL